MDRDTLMTEAVTEEKNASLFSPLNMDLKVELDALVQVLHRLPTSSQDMAALQAYAADLDHADKSQVLDSIARLMLRPDLTLYIVKTFRPLAIDLVARWLTPRFLDFLVSPDNFHTVYRIETMAKAFSVILPIVPQTKSLAVTFFAQSPSLFERLNYIDSYNHVENGIASNTALIDLLLTTYRLLSYSAASFSPLWSWSPLFSLLSSSTTNTVRYLTILCLSRVYGITDKKTSEALHALTNCNEAEVEEFLVDIDSQKVDLRALTIFEQERLAKAQIEMLANSRYNKQPSAYLAEGDLSALTIDLCGILLPKPQQHVNENGEVAKKVEPLVLTETTAKNLHTIGLALSMGAPVLLEGVTGAGKTALVEEVARKVGRLNELVKIHLGDQTDSKVLLGTYVATSTPGSFKWQPGVLTTAVREGRWVLIEDIDLAPAEVISMLLPLLESRHLFIPSRGEKLKAKEGFQLFATRSLIPSKGGRVVRRSGGANTSIGSSLWTKVEVEPLSQTELDLVIRKKFINLASFSKEVMKVFLTIVDIYQDPNFSSLASSTMGRFISTRDLMKWCYRINVLVGAKQNGATGKSIAELGMDEAVRQDLFSEAIDCFCGMISNYAHWVTILEKIGESLQLSREMVNLYIAQYKPSLNITETSINIGRVNFDKKSRAKEQGALVKRERKRPFATTSHALRLLERIAVCVHLNEPILLVGETGTGKTTVVQHLADMMDQNLVVVNLSQQSDSSDLLGGFKPVDGKIIAIPLKEEFEKLFERTFSVKKNAKFIEMVRKTYIHKKWVNFAAVLRQAVKMADARFEAEQEQKADAEKKKKISSPQLRNGWKQFAARLSEFEVQQSQMENKFVFSFLEGSLVKAVRRGDWILLDEINLATTETLECLSGLLQDASGSLLLTEKGDAEPIKRHPNFRVFACMNPATDVGKRDLPPGLRNRFTEFYVHPPDSRREDLLQIVRQYLSNVVAGDERACEDVADFYLEAKKLAAEHKLVDGANQRPHYSMRTLARALTYINQISASYGLRRSLYEGFCMTFMTPLDKESTSILRDLIYKTLLKGVKNPGHLITQIPKQPSDDFVQFGYFWLEKGPQDEEDPNNFILTPSVEVNLFNLARVVMSGKFPVLIQGPTSSGKTSMVEYVAKRTGHRFVRINNHENTDLQEYLGTYVSNAEGKLVFQEGVLVEALRKGYWIVLDELNLAPSDVLEALNRLLDDNRELLIPETQEIVKPHPQFMLFATQNPAGLYGGRKALSRAFRNRFLELYFDDIPEAELETILSKRCAMAPSYCQKLVQVYKALMERRQSTRIFEQKHGFITLRDLFRWAGRDAMGYQELAEHGYMLLAERCRKAEEKLVVKEVLEKVMKVKIDEDKLYDCEALEEFAIYDKILKEQTGTGNKLVWTKAMRRLYSLVTRCIRFNEPVLLVGETGCGKTTVCQMLAETKAKNLSIVNCHQNTETADLLGGQRPVRNKNSSEYELKAELLQVLGDRTELNLDSSILDLMDEFNALGLSSDEDHVRELQQKCKKARTLFEWHDGPLVQTLKDGDFFLLDEISLADDSVLERLNSVLEPHRLLVLAEKGGKNVEELYAKDGFQFFATMNPGGDYGKKELSPALRNRFTEIWVPAVSDKTDLIQIIDEQLQHKALDGYGLKILEFIDWYSNALGQTRLVVSLRDILSWVNFMNSSIAQGLDARTAFVHGGCLVLLDGLGSHASSGSLLSGSTLRDFRLKCLRHMVDIKGKRLLSERDIIETKSNHVVISDDQFSIGPFHIPRGPHGNEKIKFTLLAPTTSDNAMRVVRAMQVRKPILLEGSPGVGKTSLVSALAAASGHKLVRINLSEQTDLMDLFGSDLPVEGGNSGEFAWRDAPFLQAMKAGDWVLLDELNLASQSVLEGLNSCLDHRGAVYIPELDREFFCAKEFRVFGAQNPLQQGGGRKGLPKSFVNRFTQVYVEQLDADDLLFICSHLFPTIDQNIMKQMIEFNTLMYEETMINCTFGRKGSPWEFNLRDVFRWLELMQKVDNMSLGHVPDPSQYLETIYLQRLRTEEDRHHTIRLYEKIFKCHFKRSVYPYYHVSRTHLQVGNAFLHRRATIASVGTLEQQQHLLQSSLAPLETLMKCVEMNWMAIINGPSSSGKTTLIRLLSNLTGNVLEEFAMNGGVDTMELLGGFEQVDLARHRQVIRTRLHRLTTSVTKSLMDSLAASGDNIEQRVQVIAHVRQLNDAFFTFEHQHKMNEASTSQAELNTEKFDYVLIERILDHVQSCNVQLDKEDSINLIRTGIDELKVLEASSVSGRFEWIDGVLINALENGHWLLIDNANLCNPSVLDRLNPLFENNGVLMVNERGLVDGEVKVIKPHPNFRMFMTVDPRNGELSRAMRNRGVEISLIDSSWMSNEQSVKNLVNASGIRGSKLPLLLRDFHQHVVAKSRFSKELNARDLLMVCEFLYERLQRGQDFISAAKESLSQVYPLAGMAADDDSIVSLMNLLENVPADADDFKQLVAPAACPHIISGNFLKENSVFATISLQGAVLFALLIDQYRFTQDPELSQQSLETAAQYFIETTTFQDYQLRMQWLRHVATQNPERTSTSMSAKISQSISTVLSHSLSQSMFDLHSRLSSLLDISPEYLNALPMDLSQNPQFAASIRTIVRHHEDKHELKTVWQQILCTSKAQQLLVRLVMLEYTDNDMRRSAEKLKLGNLTVLQQSYCHGQGRLNENQLSHPIIASLYPAMEATKQTVLDWINQNGYLDASQEVFKLIAKLLDDRNNLMVLLNITELNLGDLLILLKMFKKTAVSLRELDVGPAEPLVSLLQSMVSTFDLATGKSMKLLWNHFRPTTLSTQGLFDVEQNILNVASSISYFTSDMTETCDPSNIAFHINNEVKGNVIEGAATLYVIDEDSSKNALQLAKSLVSVPELLKAQLEDLRKQLIIESNVSAPSVWSLALLPVVDHTSMIKEMEVISNLMHSLCTFPLDKSKLDTVRQLASYVKDFDMNNSSRSPMHLVPYQRLIWLLEGIDESNAEKARPYMTSLLRDLTYNWHDRLWRSSYLHNSIFNLKNSETGAKVPQVTAGSGSIYEAVETLACLNIVVSVNNMPVNVFDDAVAELKKLRSHLMSKSEPVNRFAMELNLVIQNAYQMFIALTRQKGSVTPSTCVSVFENLDLILSKLSKQYPVEALSQTLATELHDAVVALAKELSGMELPEAYILGVQSVVDSITSLKANDSTQFLRCIGRARAFLALGFIQSYVPNYPLDPTAKPRMKVQLLQTSKSHLEMSIAVRREIEQCFTGNDTNETIEKELQQISQIDETLDSSLVTFSLRPAQSQLGGIFIDLHHLKESIVNNHASALIKDLNSIDSSDKLLHREALLQDNTLQFIDRATSKYPMYRDLLQPLLDAVHELKYGVRLMVNNFNDTEIAENTVIEKIISALAKYPSTNVDVQDLDWHLLAEPRKLAVVRHIIFSRSSISRKWAFYLKYLIVILQRLVLDIGNYGHLQPHDVAAIDDIYSEISRVWKASEEHAKKVAMEEEQLYKTRVRKHDGVTDEEIDEADLKRMFADFSEDFVDLMDENLNEDTRAAPEEIEVEEANVLDDEDVYLIGKLHLKLFSMYSYSAHQEENSLPTKDIRSRSYDMAGQLSALATTPANYMLDVVCRHGHLVNVQSTIERLEATGAQSSGSQPAIYDFYQSENVGEAKRIYPILNAMKIRVLDLLDQWPEHAVLQQLVVVIDRLLGFPIVSPIAKLLTGIELLLQKSEDWEAYASKDVSIKEHRDAVVALIVSWRQLELNSWPKLLAAQEQYSQDGSYKWWFHLYDTVITTSVQTGSDEKNTENTKNLLSVLDHFLQSSPIGEFKSRLNMVDSFRHHLDVESHFTDRAGGSGTNYKILSTILYNVHEYYSQFSSAVQAMLERLRKPIEKELKDFVKIASWKDVNIYALRQSAQKTHKQLHKCIRKYKDVLSRSTLDVIGAYNEEISMYQYGDEKKYNDVNHGFVSQLSAQTDAWLVKSKVPSIVIGDQADAKDRFKNMDRTFTRLQSYFKSDILPTNPLLADLPLEAFMTEVIQQIKTFQKETPTVLTDENKSQIKLQKVLKKKSLGDFLKQLKRLGLKIRVPVLAEQNKDNALVFRQRKAEISLVLQDRDLLDEPLSYISWAAPELIKLWEKANTYYFSSVARISHLRNVSTINVHPDISLTEVERSMSATEHMLAFLRQERSALSKAEMNMSLLQGISVQIAATCAQSNLRSFETSENLIIKKMAVDKLVDVLDQTVQLLQLQSVHTTIDTDLVQMLSQLLHDTRSVQKDINGVYKQVYLYPSSTHSVDIILVNEDVEFKLKTTNEFFRQVQDRLVDISSFAPDMQHMLYAISQHVAELLNSGDKAKSSHVICEVSVIQDQVHGAIDAILTSIQDMRSLSTKVDFDESELEYGMPENHIRDQHANQIARLNALHLDVLGKRLLDLLNTLSTYTNAPNSDNIAVISSLLQQLYPFVQQHLLITQRTLCDVLLHHKAMAKLTYVLINSFTLIMKKGFCLPEGMEDDAEGDGLDDNVQGTGVGEGQGSKDVSDQIEDEEQVLGTQNEMEQAKDEKNDTKEEKNGLEMENDFDGDLEDIEQDEDDDNQKEEDDDEEEDEEMDDQVGDVDDLDPDAVDDKMWGDDSAEGLNESDKTVDEDKSNGQQQDSDIVAKEESSDAKEQTSEQQQDDNNEQGDNEEGDGNEPEIDEEAEEGEEEDGQDNKPGEQMNAEIPEAETLDLPDDLMMDGDEGEEGEEEKGEDFNDSMDVDEQGQEDEMMEEEGEAFKDKLDEAEPEGDDGQDIQEEADGTAQMKDEEKEEEEAKEENEGGEEGDNPQDHQDNAEEGGKIEEDEDEQAGQHGPDHEVPNADTIADNQFGVQGSSGKASSSTAGQQEGDDEDAEESASKEEPQSKRQDKQGKSEHGKDDATAQAEETSNEPKNEEDKTNDPNQPNPQRSLGDALEAWKRRLADVTDAADEEEGEDADEKKQDEAADEIDVQDNHAFEYIKNDEESHDMQTMGSAAQDQLKQLDLGAMDETVPESEDQVAGEMDVDEPQEDTSDTLPQHPIDSDKTDMKGAILNKRNPQQTSEEGETLTTDGSVIAHEPMEEKDIENLREELENKVSQWRDQGRDENVSRELWQQYENITHDLALGLCEQLRLILEPTLATKLKGDYRTGKRLNMKKIIPYIASQFKKDKIWLRRTKPSKRQYQVMISVDDSKSMSESHSVQLAYETLALISKAMSQLEVGDIAITSFGERIQLLHPFDQPFTDDSGASVLRQFTFGQEKTYVKKLVETSISLLENAKNNHAGNGDLWQLQLIVSDGICEDHEALKALVREAAEHQIMIIFIVVDNKPEKDSILNTTNVKYSMVNGKMSLQMTPYLESFPFQYFLILRDINALPEVLSDALRQYFSFVTA
ncbi:AAA ATPase midasin [Umbelopsis sp. WA50703]